MSSYDPDLAAAVVFRKLDRIAEVHVYDRDAVDADGAVLYTVRCEDCGQHWPCKTTRILRGITVPDDWDVSDYL